MSPHKAVGRRCNRKTRCNCILFLVNIHSSAKELQPQCQHGGITKEIHRKGNSKKPRAPTVQTWHESGQKKLHKELQSPKSAPCGLQSFKGHSQNFKGHLQLYPKGPLREGAWSSNPARAGSPSINDKTVGQRQMRRSPDERREVEEEACGTAGTYRKDARLQPLPILSPVRVGTRPVRYTTTALTDLTVLKVGCSDPFGEPAEHTAQP